MAKLNNADEFFESIRNKEKLDKECNKEKVKRYFRKNSMLPIVKNEELLIYQVKCNKKSFENLIDDFEKKLSDTTEKIVKKEIYMIPKNRAIYGLNKLTNVHTATENDIWKFFELDLENNRNIFYNENVEEKEVKIPIDNITFTKGFRKETLDEIIKRISSDFIIGELENKSKLCTIISDMINNNYFNLDLIAESIYEFLNISKLGYIKRIIGKDLELFNMSFTETEKNLSSEEKLELLKKVYFALNFECIFSKKIEDIINDEYKLNSINNEVNMNALDLKETIIDFAYHNTNILKNSDFTDIYQMFFSFSSIKAEQQLIKKLYEK